MDNTGYTIRCVSHTYIELKYNGKHVYCYDDCCMYMEEIIYRIQKRTGMKFKDIPIKGHKEDFTGLRFFYGGWHRNVWDDMPTDAELDSYMRLKRGDVVKNGKH